MRPLFLAGAFLLIGCSSSSQVVETTPRCDGRRMATVVNLSDRPVEAVAVRGGVVSVLALAPPGLTSRPFQPPLPGDRDLAGGVGRSSYWFYRDAATGRQLGPRDPQVKTEWVCVSDGAR